MDSGRVALLVMAFLLCGMTALGREQVREDLSADSVTLLREHNAAVAGRWQYDSPAVELAGTNLVSAAGKPIAKGKVRGKLKKMLKRLGIAHRRTTLTLNNGGTWVLELRGRQAVSGSYTFDPSTSRLNLLWHGIALTFSATVNNGKLRLIVSTDHALGMLQLLGKIIPNGNLRDLAKLASLYDHMDLGVTFKRQK